MCVAPRLRACGGLLPGGVWGWAVSDGNQEGCAGDAMCSGIGQRVIRQPRLYCAGNRGVLIQGLRLQAA